MAEFDNFTLHKTSTMDLKQYTQQKRRNPLILLITITLTIFLILIVYKNMSSPKKKTQQESNTQIIFTTELQHVPDSIFPVLLIKDNIVIQAFTSSIPKDTAFMVSLSEGINSFKLIDKKFHIISNDSIFYKNEKVIFINL